MKSCQIIKAFLLIIIFVSLYSCSDEAEDAGWTWGDRPLSGLRQGVVVGYIGCSILEEFRSVSNKVTFSCGYQITSLLPDRIKHLEEQENIDDGSLDGFAFTGVVLVSHATQTQLESEQHDRRVVPISDILRVAKTAKEIEKPEKVFFESVSINIYNIKFPQKTKGGTDIERYWEEVNSDFILCWDNINTKHRAYQLISPTILSSAEENSLNIPVSDCNTFIDPVDHYKHKKALFACYPLLDQYVKDQYIRINDEPENKVKFTDFIDEVLPRPF